MEKIEKDGNVAVLYSPGFGAGWSTWSGDEMRETLCMDAEIVQAVLDGDKKKAAEIAEGKFEEYVCILGAEDLEVEWIKKGQAFEIEDYDGNENIHIIGDRNYLVA